MKSKEVEAHLKTAVTKAVPDVLSSILSECDERKGKVIEMKSKTANRNWVKPLCATAAAMALLVGGVFGAGHIRANAVDVVVSLDVNPSIEIDANKNEVVLSVKGLNEDGIKIIEKERAEGTKLEGAQLEELAKELVGSMVEEGYLTELANSVLLSVGNKNAEKGSAIEKRLMDAINNALSENGLDGAIIGQPLQKNEELTAIADKLGISVGKAGLISSIIAGKPELKYEQLAGLSINDLSLLAEQLKDGSSEIKIVGTPSDKSYLSAKCAIENACINGELEIDDIVKADAKIGYLDGKLVYNVKVKLGETELNYSVDAKNGEILSIVDAVTGALVGKDGTTAGGTQSGGTALNPKVQEELKDAIADAVDDAIEKVLPEDTDDDAADDSDDDTDADEIGNAVKDAVGKVLDGVSKDKTALPAASAKPDYKGILTDIVTGGSEAITKEIMGK